jgi:hypothetical protein
LIAYRKVSGLRVVRSAAPQPPFWSAATILPYSTRRGSTVSIDYAELRASFAERLEVNVCESIEGELERMAEKNPLTSPVLIDGSEFSEVIFRRGEAALRFCRAEHLDSLMLISTTSAVPEVEPADDVVVAISAWPLEFPRLEALLDAARRSGLAWGLVVPVIFPVTTDLQALRDLTSMAKSAGARFMTGVSVDLDPTAKQAIASSLTVDADGEIYAALFHSDLETIHVATERHIAALAQENGMSDFATPPRWLQKTNWNASVLLALAGARMISMKHDVELGWTTLRSARFVAELQKPIQRVAEAAILSMVPSIDPISAEALEQWLATGKSDYCEEIGTLWRLRRDHLGEE